MFQAHGVLYLSAGNMANSDGPISKVLRMDWEKMEFVVNEESEDTPTVEFSGVLYNI